MEQGHTQRGTPETRLIKNYYISLVNRLDPDFGPSCTKYDGIRDITGREIFTAQTPGMDITFYNTGTKGAA